MLVLDSINFAANLFYDRTNYSRPLVDKATFITLLAMVSVNVLFVDKDGVFYRQCDGVAMGSVVGPLLANIFLSQFDDELSSYSKFFFRYVDDIIRTLKTGGKNYLLDFLNSMHPNFKCTLEEVDPVTGLPFFDHCYLVQEEDRHWSYFEFPCYCTQNFYVWYCCWVCTSDFQCHFIMG